MSKFTFHRETPQSVALRWEAQYPEARELFQCNSGDALDKLRQATTLDQCDAIIGNNTWSHNTCDVCGRSMRGLFRIEKQYDGFFDMCTRCYRRLVRAGEAAGVLPK